MAKLVGRCVHCGGNLFKEDGERKCLQCGRTWKTNSEVNQFYEEHKKDILADIADIGKLATIAKWQIPEGSIGKLLARWLHEREPAPAPAPTKPTDNHLPPLPQFSNDWAPEVQIKWLEAWSSRRKHMSKMLKVNDQVYHQLDQLKVGHQTFSDVIGELLTTRLKVFELINVLEGQVKYREWQQKELAKVMESQRR